MYIHIYGALYKHLYIYIQNIYVRMHAFVSHKKGKMYATNVKAENVYEYEFIYVLWLKQSIVACETIFEVSCRFSTLS